MFFPSNLARISLIGFQLFGKTNNVFVTDSGARRYLNASMTSMIF